MKKLFSAAFIFLLIFAGKDVAAQNIPSYYSKNYFLMASPGSFEQGLMGFANPAVIRMMKGFNTQFMWSTDGTDATSIHDWGIFSAVPGFGFNIFHQEYGGYDATDYNLNIAGGDYRSALGIGYTWSGGDMDALGRERFITVGTLGRN